MSQPSRPDPVETRGPEIPESVYEEAAAALDLAVEGGWSEDYCGKVARIAVDAAVAELGLTVERMEPDPRSLTKFAPQVRLVGPWKEAKNAR